MTVIQKKILVPENRRITLELPTTISAGDTADIVVTVTRTQTPSQSKSILELAGALSDSKTFVGDSVALIRELRDEW